MNFLIIVSAFVVALIFAMSLPLMLAASVSFVFTEERSMAYEYMSVKSCIELSLPAI